MSEKTIADAYKRIASDPDGAKVFADLMHRCGVYDSVNETDPIRLALIQGARNVAMHIAARLNYSPMDVVERAKEDEHIYTSMFINSNGETFQ